MTAARRNAGTSRQKIAVKRDGYENPQACEVILFIEQRSFAAMVPERRDEGWIRTRLIEPDQRLVLPAFGLDCRLVDLHARTSLIRARHVRARHGS